MTSLAQRFLHLVTTHRQQPNSHTEYLALIVFVTEVLTVGREVLVLTERRTRSRYPLQELCGRLEPFGVLVYRRPVTGARRYGVYAAPILPGAPATVVPLPVPGWGEAGPPLREVVCGECGGFGRVEMQVTRSSEPETLPCWACDGHGHVPVCTGCEQEPGPLGGCACVENLAVAA